MTASGYPHLRITREANVTVRRPPGGHRPSIQPDDPRAHGKRLLDRLDVLQSSDPDIAGYDDRRLVRLHLGVSIPPEEIKNISKGLSVVSQEDKKLVLAFATEEQLIVFRQKLGNIAKGSEVSYRNLIYAIRDVDQLTAEDRMSWSLKTEGIPPETSITVDVELWPLAVAQELDRLRAEFEQWLEKGGGELIDSVTKPYLSLYRIKGSSDLIENLLLHRDVRLVDLPPRVALDPHLRGRSVQDLQPVPNPPPDAPGVVVLDSGIASGHPVLAPAVGDSQSFLVGRSAADVDGHGTGVAGIALYGDVAECVANRRFAPELRLYSGRILDEHGRGDHRLVENQVEDAVRYFVDHYDCKVFNLSYGDQRKPYHGRHVRGLAVTLDSLSRELDVLFVVPTGNLDNTDDIYPDCFLGKDARIIDPASSLNALTVGSLARYDHDTRWPEDPGFSPVARPGQPSPFTRRGPSVNGAIKPDLVDYGGNELLEYRPETKLWREELGEISTSQAFATGAPFGIYCGTSYAAPRISNLAATLLAHLPDASVDLCRAVLVAHADVPASCEDLCSHADIDVRDVAGYGKVNRNALFRSLDDCVTLWAMDSIENKQHQFYEIPIPAEYWAPGRRSRKMTIALAHRSPVRTTRIDYRAVRITFRLVQAMSVEEVAQSFNAEINPDDAPSIGERSPGRNIALQRRSLGTVQGSTWEFRQPSSELRKCRWVVVVTRNDPPWGEGLSTTREKYALAMVLDDRQAGTARLYEAIRARLHARPRLRVTQPA